MKVLQTINEFQLNAWMLLSHCLQLAEGGSNPTVASNPLDDLCIDIWMSVMIICLRQCTAMHYSNRGSRLPSYSNYSKDGSSPSASTGCELSVAGCSLEAGSTNNKTVLSIALHLVSVSE